MDKITELREKVEKDPSSKLFVPLAEEYRKAGMLDEAVKVLKDGLGRQPKHTSARVALGKIYLEQGLLDEARAEFEAVVSSIPDNLFARRKLADILKQKGETLAAIEQYRRVLKLNPMDEEAQSILEDLSKPPAPEKEVAEPAQEAAEEELSPEDEEFLLSLARGEGLEAEEWPEHEGEALTPLTMVEEGEELTFAGEEKEEETLEAAAEEAAPVEEVLEETEAAEVEAEAEYLDAVEAEAVEEETLEAAWEEAAPVEEVLEETEAAEVEAETEYLDEEFEELSPVGEALKAPSEEQKAQEHVRNEEYAEAIEVYEGILKRDPDNKVALQGLHELQSLLKLLGRDKDITAARLEKFLDGIMKRKNEFFGNA
jgi:tetratricopeptide (TPR) repeat protein